MFMNRPNISNQKRNRKAAINPLLPLAVSGLVLSAIGVAPRVENQLELSRVHSELTQSVPVLNAIVVKPAPADQSISLPGDLQAIQDIPIYARANGYLVKRFVDIGDNVKAGELLALISTPELDQQVAQAAASLGQAQANLATALSDRDNYSAQLFASNATIKQMHTNLDYSSIEVKRYQVLANEGAVSWEQRDQALRQVNSDTAALEVAQRNKDAQTAQLAAANTRITAANQAVESAQANLKQLKALQGFQKIVAPADGVITNRFIDAGALVAAGGSNGTTEILAMANTDTLRIYVDVPQSDYRYIHNGDKATLSLQEFPGKTFTGTVTNIAGSLNANSRTLQTEIHVDNHDHVLKPGSYAEVSFHYTNTNPPMIIPSNASITKNDGLYVAVVNNNRIAYRPIQVARDYGNKLEVSTGISPNDVVVLDAPDGLAAGTVVNTKVLSTL